MFSWSKLMQTKTKRTRFYTIIPHRTYHRDRSCSYLKSRTWDCTDFLAVDLGIGENINWNGRNLTSCPRCGR